MAGASIAKYVDEYLRSKSSVHFGERPAGRPLLRRYFPAIAHARQPIGGIVLLKREIAEGIHWHSGWSVDVGLTIEIAKKNLAYEEVRIGPIMHAERTSTKIAEMADEIVGTILAEAGVLRIEKAVETNG